MPRKDKAKKQSGLAPAQRAALYGFLGRRLVSDFRILVADDHEVVRRGISSLLSNRAGWEVCAEASDGREAVEKTEKLRPDLVLLDLHMPNLNGMEAARQILRHNSQQRILVLTITDSEHMAQELLRVGVMGYVLKSDAATDLVAAVEALQQNRTFFNSGVDQMVLEGYLNGGSPSFSNHRGLSNLTAREREILQLLAEGKTTKQVAVTLDLSVKTAETHRSNIMRKLNLHSVSELVLYAVRNNVVHIPAPYAKGMPLIAAGD
jgi:DNA-binding NarL/FixJ family response regulator